MGEVREGENYRRDAEGAKKGERINPDCTEKNGEHREGQRRDDDARSVVLRLSRYPSHEAKARRMGHPSVQNQVQNEA